MGPQSSNTSPPPAHGADSGEGVATRLGEGERCRTGSGAGPIRIGAAAGHQEGSQGLPAVTASRAWRHC